MSQIKWTHKPGSPVPWQSPHYAVGQNFSAMYQATKWDRNHSRPLGEPCCTPEEAKAICEADAAKVAA